MTHAASPFRRPDAQSSDSPYSRSYSAVDPSLDDATVEAGAYGPALADLPTMEVVRQAPGVDDEPDLLAQPPLDDDLNERIAKSAPRRLANRATYVLAGLALLVAGFVGGAQVQKSYGTAPAASGPGGVNPAALANRGGGQGFPGTGQGGTGQGGTGTGGRGGITGTVKLVDGTTVYVESADGTTYIVKTSDKTTVSAPGALKDLTAGSTVTVQGQNAEGTVTATAITKSK
ncbi:hypothetical protein AB0M46_34640 [Dactylosporangium sp. NPDC051485]|uniref:hypothetical protein n=1 Tax=Dactylosporangium sp. NPDC051485 TaxID=3154846 RepID=UPI00343024DF